MGREYIFRTTPHDASHSCKETIWDYMLDIAERVAELKQAGVKPITYRGMRRRAEKSMPHVRMQHIAKNLDTDKETRRHGDTVPLAKENEEISFIEASVPVISRLLHENKLLRC